MHTKTMSFFLVAALIVSLLPTAGCSPIEGTYEEEKVLSPEEPVVSTPIVIDERPVDVETPLEARCDDLSQFPATEALVPDVATDGDTVCIYGDFSDDLHRVVLRGYKYTQPPRFDSQGGTEFEGERECLYCGCIPAQVTTGSGDDVGGTGERLCFDVPLNAPTGEYEVTVLPRGNICSAGEWVTAGEELCPDDPELCPSDPCQSFAHTLYVMPAYLVSLWDKLEVRADAEPDSCNWRPAELSFAFAGSSGNPMTETNFPVEFAGVYPAPASGSGHVTALDGTNQRPQVPVFIGRQDRMLLTECIEESVSKGDPELETLQCIKDYDLGRYSDDFSIGLSGIEDDPGGTPWYAYAGGLGAAALACTASYKLTGGWKEELGCAGGIATGYEIGKKIADWAGEDDDNLGTVDLTVNVSGGAGAGTQTRLLEGGDEGDLSVSFVTDRVGGLPILEYRVQIESVKLQEPYELNCFDAGNELILQARAVLVKDSATALNPSVPERFPEDGYEKVTPYEDGTFPEWVVNWTVAWESFEDPQWSPLLYLEFLLWEDDGDDHEADLIGIHSHSYSLSTLAAGSNDDAVSGGPFQGRAVRRIDFSDVVEVRGWDGSDCADCSGILATGCVCSGHRGRASVRYRIKFTWLKHALLE